MKRFRGLIGLFAALLIAVPMAVAHEASPVAAPATIGSLRFIGEQRIPNLAALDYTVIGGLSGIDYDPDTNSWVLISDDRSSIDLARFYTAELEIGADGFTGVTVTGKTTLLTADGVPYDPTAGMPAPDPESIRFDPLNPGVVWWSTEADSWVELDPRIIQTNAEGLEIGEITPDPIFALDPTEQSGSRNNLGFEGLSFSADGETIWVINESALVQDGDIATLEAGTVSRLTQYDRAGNVLAQYVYDVDPIQAVPTGCCADNGVSELLAIDEHRFLVLERSGVSTAEGPWTVYIRIYVIDITDATNVSGEESLIGAEYTPVSKSLLLNIADTDLGWTDNIEGISWGPVLPNGNRTLVLVSDNNFNPDTQVTQFLAYEVLP